jgi:hypothetical protein
MLPKKKMAPRCSRGGRKRAAVDKKTCQSPRRPTPGPICSAEGMTFTQLKTRRRQPGQPLDPSPHALSMSDTQTWLSTPSLHTAERRNKRRRDHPSLEASFERGDLRASVKATGEWRWVLALAALLLAAVVALQLLLSPASAQQQSLYESPPCAAEVVPAELESLCCEPTPNPRSRWRALTGFR